MNPRESELPRAGYADLTSAIPSQGHPEMGGILKAMSDRGLCDVAITPASKLRKAHMKRPYIKAFNALKTLGVPVFVNEDHEAQGNFGISAEDTSSRDWVAYYDAPSDWFCGVSPAIENVLHQYGLFAEWQNPGCLWVHEA